MGLSPRTVSLLTRRADFPGGDNTVLIVEDQIEMRAIHPTYLQDHGPRA